MASVSGNLLFDKTRSANPPTGMSGIANVAIVLQNIITNYMLAVMTDANGNFAFENVSNANYRVVESYGVTGVTTPGDFLNAVQGDVAVAAVPPISLAPSPPTEATNLDCTTQNTLLINVTGSNISNLHICNGPVKYSNAVIDESINVHWSENLINDAGEGHFGEFSPGTAVMTGADPNPYPNVNPGFTYVLPANGSPNPSDGQFTIQNIATHVTYQDNNVWWRIADFTTGNETGRMMIVNGANLNSIFFQDVVFIKPNTYYLFITWVLNLIKITGRVDPKLGVRIITPDSVVLFDQSIGATIPVNQEEPEWHEIGTVIKSGAFSTLTVQFVSLGAAASGNDYVIDDVGLFEVDIPLYSPVKAASSSDVIVGDIITFTVTFSNDSQLLMSNVMFTDPLSDGLVFVPESVTINGDNYEDYDPNEGFALPDLNIEEVITVTFEAIAISVPWMGRTTNTSSVTYSLQLIANADPVALTVASNTVAIEITQPLCPISFAALQHERDILSSIPQSSNITLDTSLLVKGKIEYQPNGTIDILQRGYYVVNWFASGLSGFATNGQQYTLKKFDYEVDDWSNLARAGNHIKNATTTGFAIVTVTNNEIDDYGKATIALFNNANADAELTIFEPNAGIVVWGANYNCVEKRLATIEENLSAITDHIQVVEEFLYLSEVTYSWSDTPELEGLGVADIYIGHNYVFWGFGTLTQAQVLTAGTSFYLVTNAQVPAIAFYQGNNTIGTLWIQDPIAGTEKYPLRFDGTGIYITPNVSLTLSAGTQFSFTQSLILVNPMA